MVPQSEQAFFALARNKSAAAPAVKVLEYKEMEPFFTASRRSRRSAAMVDILR
jgi:hypothetical protein